MLLKYLQLTQLTYRDMWAHHNANWRFSFDIITTNTVEVENRHLGRGLSMRSTVFDVLPQVLQLTNGLDEARRRCIFKEFLGKCVTPGGRIIYIC